MAHTLLLADDSVTIQRVIELTFADEDVNVVAVSDGDQAIERLEASPPDIVLADIGMPGRNGYEVAQYIRRSPKLSHIPVVLLTGAFEPVDQARAAEAGCDGVLAKPFEPQLVISRVKELLAKSQQLPSSINADVAPPLEIPTEQWVPPVPDPQSTPTHPVASDAVPPLDDYFDRLDAAISSHQASTPPPPPMPPTTVSPMPGEAHVAEATPLDAEIDWFSTSTPGEGTAEHWDLPAPPAAEVKPTPDLPMTYVPPEPPQAPFDTSSFEAAFDTPEFEPQSAAAPSMAADSFGPAATAVAEQPGASAAAPASIEQPHAAAPSPAAAPARVSSPALPAAAGMPTLSDAFAALLAAEQHDGPAAWPAPAPPAITDEVVERVTHLVMQRLTDRTVRDTVADIVSRVAEQLVREEIAKIKDAIKS